MRTIMTGLVMCLAVALAGFATAQEDLEPLNTRVVEAYQRGDYDEAVELAEQAVRVAERQFGEDAVETAVAINGLATIFNARSEFAHAAPLFKRAIAIFEKSLPPDDPVTATSLNNLAVVYHAQGLYTQAEPLYRRALAIREKTLAAEHPDTYAVLEHLAILHQRQGQHPQAEPLLRRMLEIREKSLGADHPGTASSLNVLALCCYSQGKHSQAESLYKRAIAICEKSLEPDDPVTATSLNNLAVLYHAQELYAQAETLYRRALAIREKSLDAEHPDTYASLTNLASLYESQGQYGKAEPLLQRGLEIRQKSLGTDHPDVASSLDTLASCCYLQGDYPQAEALYKRALAIRERVLGEKHPDTGQTLNGLALVYKTQGQYARAEPLYKRSLEIVESSLGQDHPNTANTLKNLADLYASQTQYSQAELLYKRTLSIRERSLGAEHRDTVSSLDDLAVLYESQGRYERAEPLYGRALAIREKTLGPEHPDTAKSLANIAAWHFYQGQYQLAEPLYKRALGILEREPGQDDPDSVAVIVRGNLASLYVATRQYVLAEPLFTRILGVREERLGPDHPDTAVSLNNLAAFHHHQGQFAQAEPLFERAVAIYERALGPDHPDTAKSLHNLANLHDVQGSYEKAEPLFRRAITILEKSLGPGHPQTVLTLHSLAHVEFALGRPAEAAELLDRARRGVRRHAARVLPSLSPAEQTSFLGEQDEAAFHRAITRGLVDRASPTLAALSAGWLANGKAVAHEAASQQVILARTSSNPATAESVAALQAIRGEAARVSQQIPASDKAAAWRAAIDGLQAEEHRLIHDIGGQLAALDRDEPWVEIDEIRRTIPGGSVLVDIARFGIFDFKANGKNDKWQPARYAAWITPPAGNGDVTIVDLGDAAEIDGLVADYRRAIEGRLVDLDAAEPLSAKVLWPILAALPSGGATVEELVLSPDGALWLVPWQALPLKDGSFAIERYAIRTVTSGRDLVPPPMDAAPREGALPPLVVADPAFDEAPRESEPSAVAVASTPALPGSAGRVLPKVQGLAATRREAEAARGSLAKVAGLTPAVRVGREATAAGVQREAVRPKVLVLATHGFFLADQQVKHDERLMLAHTRGIAGTRPLDTATGKPAEDPLLRCGLLFTGANLPAERLQPGGDDGVLTGAEIVGLDLLGTDLVVLSACETGVGRVDVGEGVAGLRQAFQIAGAKTVIATLWHVPDKESAEIMSAFYENLADGQPPSRALRTAQISFIRAHREKNDAATDHPYYWAAYGTTGR